MRVTNIIIGLVFILCTGMSCDRKNQIGIKGFYPLKEKMELKGFSDACKDFITKELRPNWLLHGTKECYYDNQELWENVLSHEMCFLGKERSQIQLIFGQPHETITLKDKWDKYFLGKICQKNYQYVSLQFQYNENGVLKNIGQGQIRNN